MYQLCCGEKESSDIDDLYVISEMAIRLLDWNRATDQSSGIRRELSVSGIHTPPVEDPNEGVTSAACKAKPLMFLGVGRLNS